MLDIGVTSGYSGLWWFRRLRGYGQLASWAASVIRGLCPSPWLRGLLDEFEWRSILCLSTAGEPSHHQVHWLTSIIGSVNTRTFVKRFSKRSALREIIGSLVKWPTLWSETGYGGLYPRPCMSLEFQWNPVDIQWKCSGNPMEFFT